MLLSACAPPFRTLSIGIGELPPTNPPRCRYSGMPSAFAAAYAVASETAISALPPSRSLLAVPSSASIAASIRRWSRASSPLSAGAISAWMPSIAFKTPLPPYALPPSRFSCASWAPVEAPDGADATPIAPDESRTSASIVGVPRESKICRARTDSMIVMVSTSFRAVSRVWSYFRKLSTVL